MTYRPCRTGLHVCGADAEEIEPVTVLNLPATSAEEARRRFALAKAECAQLDGEDPDLVVDLMIAGDIEEDFRMRRQMLQRLEAAAA